MSMTELEVIGSLEKIIKWLEFNHFDVTSAKRFFDVGEWLICLEAIEEIIQTHNIRDKNIEYIVSKIRQYFDS